MLIELHLILVFIYLTLLIVWGCFFILNYMKNGLNLNIILYILITSMSCIIIPDIINFFNIFNQKFFYNLDFSVFLNIVFLISLLFIPIAIAALSIFAQVEFKYKNFYFLLFLAAFVVGILYNIISSTQIVLLDGVNSYTFITLQPTLFVLILGILIIIPIIAYLSINYKIMKKLKSKSVKLKYYFLLFMVFLKVIKFFLILVLNFSWFIIIVGDILDLLSITFIILILTNSNFIDLIILLSNIESVYITDNEGNILHNITFISGKNKATHDMFIGGLIMGSDEVAREINVAREANLSRIILNDGTAIIIEKSEKSNLYFSIFTRRYTKFTHGKVIALKSLIDESSSNFVKNEQENFNSSVMDKKILGIFLK